MPARGAQDRDGGLLRPRRHPLQMESEGKRHRRNSNLAATERTLTLS